MDKLFEWDKEKNAKLIQQRGISFEGVVSAIESGDVLDILKGRGRYGHQKQYLVQINQYLYLVPFVEDADKIFLKTIIPSRKLTKRWLLGGI